jgi:hypothetical protein
MGGWMDDGWMDGWMVSLKGEKQPNNLFLLRSQIGLELLRPSRKSGHSTGAGGGVSL